MNKKYLAFTLVSLLFTITNSSKSAESSNNHQEAQEQAKKDAETQTSRPQWNFSNFSLTTADATTPGSSKNKSAYPGNSLSDRCFQGLAHAGGLKLATIIARDVTKNSDNKWIKFSGEFVDETASNNLGSNLLLFVSNKEASEAEILISAAIVEGSSHALSKIKCIENFNKKYDQFFKDRQLEKVGYYGKVGAKSIATVATSFCIDSARRKVEQIKRSR